MDSTILNELEALLFHEPQDGDKGRPWLSSCPLSMSSHGDRMALAVGSKLALLSQKKSKFQPQVWSRGRGDEITSVLCLPLTDSGSKKGQGHIIWHCVVVGYKSGFVEWISDSGECLARRRFMEAPVTALRSSVTTTLGGRRSEACAPFQVPAVMDVLVLYPKTLVSVGGRALYETLCDNRAWLAEATARGDDLDDEAVKDRLSDVQCKKFHSKEQESMADVCVMSFPNVNFDRLNHMSFNANINETHLNSLGKFNQIVTVGDDPCLQFNLPYNVQRPDINELAENVVSTVKTGLVRMATGMLWGGSSTQAAEKEERKDPEQKLVTFHAFKDPLKTAIKMEKSPNNLYIAMADTQNRVLVLDAMSGLVINVWKGYHHVQIGWLFLSSKEAPEDIQDEYPPETKTANLLVIYLPRRGALEIVSVERKVKVAEFAVSKFGRLIQTHNGILDGSGQSSYSRSHVGTCHFLDGETGRLMQIVIPFHCIVNQSSAAHDLIQQQKLLCLIKEGEKPDRKDEAKELVLSCKTATGKMSLLVDMARSSVFDKEDVIGLTKEILKEEEAKLSQDEDESSPKPVIVFLERIVTIGNLYNVLIKDEDLPWNGQSNEEFLETLGGDAGALQPFIERLEGRDQMDTGEASLSFSDLFKWFEISAENFDVETTDIKQETKPQVSSQIFNRLCLASHFRCEDVTGLFESLGTPADSLVEFSLKNLESWNDSDIRRLSPTLTSVFKAIFALVKESQQRMILVGSVRTAINKSNVTTALYFASHRWYQFLAAEDQDDLFLPEAARYISLCEAYLNSLRHLQSMMDEMKSDSKKEYQPPKPRTLEDVFNQGDGRIAEIFAQWLMCADIGAEDLEEEHVQTFLTNCSGYFPKSLQSHVLLCHLTWECFHQWNKDRSEMHLLRQGVKTIETMAQNENAPLVNALGVLTWKTFFMKVVRDAVNLTEIRAPRRCLREVGIPERELSELLLSASALIKVIIDTDSGVTTGKERGLGNHYDDSSMTKSNHLLDLLYSFNTASGCFDSEGMSVYYQFAFVSCLVMRFELEVKPLKLFSHQESNLFFQSDSGMSVTSLLSGSHQHGLKKYRKVFITLAAEGMAGLIQTMVTSELDTAEYGLYFAPFIMLGKMWFMVDYVRASLSIALYKYGYDLMAKENWTFVSDRRENLLQLLHIALVRTAKYLFEHEDHLKMVVHVRPSLMERLHVLREEGHDSVQLPLAKTRDLLLMLCNEELEQSMSEMAYDCLSLVQMYLKR